ALPLLALTVVDHVLHTHLHAAGAGADGVRGIAHHRGGRAVTAGGPAASRSLRTGGARSLGTRALRTRTRPLRTGGRGAAGPRGGLRGGWRGEGVPDAQPRPCRRFRGRVARWQQHTSELQSRVVVAYRGRLEMHNLRAA